MFPPCFSCRSDYVRWLDSGNRDSLPAGHCSDCLPSFKTRMMNAGRCEHPETYFVIVYAGGFNATDEGGLAIIGSWPRKRAMPVKLVKPVKIKRTSPIKTDKTIEDYWAKQERTMRDRLNVRR